MLTGRLWILIDGRTPPPHPPFNSIVAQVRAPKGVGFGRRAFHLPNLTPVTCRW